MALFHMPALPRLAALALCAPPQAAVALSVPVPIRYEPSPPVPIHYELDLSVDFGTGLLRGRAAVTVENRSREVLEGVPFLLYRLLRVEAAWGEDGLPRDFTQRVEAFADAPLLQVNRVDVRLPRPLEPGGRATVTLDYAGYLAGYVETGSLYIRDRVDSTFTILRQDAFAYPVVGLPAREHVLATVGHAFSYTARVTAPEGHTVANGGGLVARTVRDGRATFEYRNLRPAWRMDFAIARYAVLESGGRRVFHFPEDSAGGRRVLDELGRAMALYTGWFGPLDGEAGFAVIEIPDGWGSQADVTSILQTAAAFRDGSRAHELYHEVSHLWNVRPLEPHPARVEEGLATFLQYLAVERLQGRPAVDEAARRLEERLRTRFRERPAEAGIPLARYGEEALTDLSYPVGMLMFRSLFELVGEEAFREIVGGFYRKYRASGATLEDFVAHADAVTEVELRPFFREWLYTTAWREGAGGAPSLRLELGARDNPRRRPRLCVGDRSGPDVPRAIPAPASAGQRA